MQADKKNADDKRVGSTGGLACGPDMDILLYDMLAAMREFLLKYGVAHADTEKVLLNAMYAVNELRELRKSQGLFVDEC